MTNAIKWEKIEDEHAGQMYRTATPTGWLVYRVDDVLHDVYGRGLESNFEWRSALTFVPDPEHIWLVPAKELPMRKEAAQIISDE